jgi:hypothetical protein
MEICKIIIESGFFYLASQQRYYPHRRARWGNRIFLVGPTGTDWEGPALVYRDFIRYSQNYFTQIDSLRLWVLPLPLPDLREGDLPWGPATYLWDNGGSLWPGSPIGVGVPHINWSGTLYRPAGAGNRPFPPAVSYRYPRLSGLGGRQHYAHLRCIERRFDPYSGTTGGEKLPFFVDGSLLDNLHATQIAEPLVRSGLNEYHDSASAIREVLVSHRDGATSTWEVTGYGQGITITTARNFSLPVL